MRTSLLCALSVPVLSMTLAAQVGPGIASVDMTQSPWRPPSQNNLHPQAMVDLATGTVIWSTSGASSTDFGQLELRSIGGTKFRLAATLNNATSGSTGGFINGPGGFEAVEGEYDTATGVCGLTDFATPLCSTGDEFAFSISNNGLFGVTDYAGAIGSPVYGNRAATGTNWTLGGVVTGAGSGYLDSKLVDLGGGGIKFAFADASSGVSVGDINTGTGAVTNIAQVIAAIPGTNFLHSHHAVMANDTLAGWIFSAHIAGGDSDSYFLGDSDDLLNLPVQIYDEANWQANPTSLGDSGSTYWAWSAPAPNNYKAPLDIELVALTGGRLTAGQTKNLSLFVPGDGNPWVGVLIIGVPTAPIPLGGTVGNAIGNAPGPRPAGQVSVLPAIAVSAAGLGRINFGIPVPAGWTGAAPLSIQGAAASTAGGPVVISNDALIQ